MGQQSRDAIREAETTAITPAERRALRAYVALVRASEAVSRRIHIHLQDAGLTVSRFAVLEALFHLGPSSQAELGHKILRSPNNVTTVIDNLERSGLVERRPDEADRRIKVVHLTRAGRTLIEEVFPRHAAVAAADLSVLKAGELETLTDLCKRVGLRRAAPAAKSDELPGRSPDTPDETRDDDKEPTT